MESFFPFDMRTVTLTPEKAAELEAAQKRVSRGVLAIKRDIEREIGMPISELEKRIAPDDQSGMFALD